MTHSVNHPSCLFQSAVLDTSWRSHLTSVGLEPRLGWQCKAAGVVLSPMRVMHALRPQQQPLSHVSGNSAYCLVFQNLGLDS